jgi:dihydrofolate reductase
MRKLIVSEFVSLDGVMQAPGGKDEDRDGGFEYGGWTWPYWHEEIGASFLEAMKDCDALLLGRRTYVTHAEAFEPMPDSDPFGAALNKPKKYVVSRMLENDLVDELHLLVYPVVLGSGKKVLPEGLHKNFTLTSTKAYPTGVVALRYARKE